MYKDLLLRVPENYNIPSILTTISPELLQKILEVICNIINCTSVLNITTLEKEIEKVQNHFMKKIEDQRQQFINERNEYIEHEIAKIHSKEIETKKQWIDTLEKKTRYIQELENERQILKAEAIEEERQRYQEIAKQTHITFELMLKEKESIIKEKENMLDVNKKIEELGSILLSFKSSNIAKGNFGEMCVQQLLQDYFPESEIQDVSSIPQNGDLVMSLHDLTIMYEIKNKNLTCKDDVLKFERDCENSIHNGFIFATSSHTIPTKGEFELTFIKKRPVLYISKILDSPKLLHIGTYILIKLCQQQCKENDHTTNELFEHLNMIMRASYTLSETLKNNIKCFDKIIQQCLEEKKINEERLSHCLFEIDKIYKTHETRLELNTLYYENKTTTALFDIILDIYKDMKKDKNKIVHKELLQRVVDSKLTQYTSIDRLLKLWPKSKFDTQLRLIGIIT